jgi:hypothetical protein
MIKFSVENKTDLDKKRDYSGKKQRKCREKAEKTNSNNYVFVILVLRLD